jgi:hypothetical protein
MTVVGASVFQASTQIRLAAIRSEIGAAVKLELPHPVSQHFSGVWYAADSLKTALPDAPRTCPEYNNADTISLHSILHELELRFATTTASSKPRAAPHWNSGRSSEGLATSAFSLERRKWSDAPCNTEA